MSKSSSRARRSLQANQRTSSYLHPCTPFEPGLCLGIQAAGHLEALLLLELLQCRGGLGAHDPIDWTRVKALYLHSVLRGLHVLTVARRYGSRTVIAPRFRVFLGLGLDDPK